MFAHSVQSTLDLGGGCFFYLSLLPGLLEFPAPTDGRGTSTLSFPVPNDVALIGFEAFTQWAIVDPSGYLGLVSLSEGMRIVVGSP